MIVLNRNVVLLTLLTFFTLLGCQKKLSSSGDPVVALKATYIQSNSVLGIYSYKYGVPDFVTAVADSPGSEIAIPETITRPSFNFGQPENPLLYVRRQDPMTAVPIDLFLKIYSPSSPTPDFYFEAPVLGPTTLPTNTTTALSWILRWSYEGKNPLYLAQNQFEALVNRVEVFCENCRKRSTTEVVGLILNNKELVNEIQIALMAVPKNNPLPSFTYNPASLDYAYSNLNVSHGPEGLWKFVDSYSEPSIASQTTAMKFDIILVNPRNSGSPVAPADWTHNGYLQETGGATVSDFPNVAGTPLRYAFDNHSAGYHNFRSIISDYSPAPKIHLSVAVGAVTKSVLCENTGIIKTRTNKALSRSLYKKIAIDGSSMPTLTFSNVAITDLSILQKGKYELSFSERTDLSGNLYYNYLLNLTAFDKETNAYIGPPIKITEERFYPGAPIKVPGFYFIANGTPTTTSTAVFYIPYDQQDIMVARTFIEDIGCYDYSTDVAFNLQFAVISEKNCDIGPKQHPVIPDGSGLTISANGDINWIPTTDLYQGPTAPADHKYRFCYNANGVKQYGIVELAEDRLPIVELTGGDFYLPLYSSQIDTIHPTFTALQSLPLNPQIYFEGAPTGETFKVIDQDGDPVKISIIVDPSSPNRLVSDNVPGTTNFFNFTNYADRPYPVNPPGTSSEYRFEWLFNPSYNQVAAASANQTIKVKVTINYDTSNTSTGDPTLTQAPLGSYTFPVTISNVLDKPILQGTTDPATGLACAASQTCLTAPIHDDPTYQDVSVDGITYTPGSKIYDLKSGLPKKDTYSKIIYGVKENHFAKLKIPVVARSANGLTYSTDPMNISGTLLIFATPYSASGTRMGIKFNKSPAASATVKVENYSQTTGLWSTADLYISLTGPAKSGNPLTNPSSATTYYLAPPVLSTEKVLYRVSVTSISGGTLSADLSYAPASKIYYAMSPTSVVSSCMFLQNLNSSNFAVSESPAGPNPSYLTAQLNKIDWIHYKLPYFSQSVCTFKVSATDLNISPTMTTTFPVTYSVYVQDVNSGFVNDVYQDFRLSESSQDYYRNLSPSAKVIKSSPTEYIAFDLDPLLIRNLGHPDNGIFFSKLAKSISDTNQYSVTETSSQLGVSPEAHFNVERWYKLKLSDDPGANPYYAPMNIRISGSGLSSANTQIKFETSTDGTTWNFASSVKKLNSADGTFSAISQPISAAGEFLILFSESEKYFRATAAAGSTNMASVSAKITNYANSDPRTTSLPIPASNNSTNGINLTAPGTFFTFNLSTVYSLRLEPLTLLLQGTGTASFKFSSEDNPNWDLTPALALQTSVESSSKTIYLQVPSNAKWFKTDTIIGKTQTPTGNTSNTLKYTLSNSSRGLDPQQKFQWRCWVLDPNAPPSPNDSHYHDCSEISSITLDDDGNSLFAPNLIDNIFTPSINSNWKPTLSMTGRQLKVKLRAIDKGYYPTITAPPVSTACQTTDPAAPLDAPEKKFSCQDLDLTFDGTNNPVNETPALPYVDIVKGAYDPNNTNPEVLATLSPYVNTTVYPTRSYNAPTFFLEPNPTSAQSFYLRIRPYSNRPVDLYDFELNQAVDPIGCNKDSYICGKKGSLDDKYWVDNLNNNGLPLRSDPVKYSSSCAPDSPRYGSRYKDCLSKGNFEFTITPDSTDGENIFNPALPFSFYTFTWNIMNSTTGANQNFQFNLRIEK